MFCLGGRHICHGQQHGDVPVHTERSVETNQCDSLDVKVEEIFQRTAEKIVEEFIDRCYPLDAERVLDRDQVFNDILRSVVHHVFLRYPASIKVTIALPPVKYAIIVQPGEDFSAALQKLDNELHHTTTPDKAIEGMRAVLLESWDVVESVYRRENRNLFLETARRIVDDTNTYFVYKIPEAIPTGIGNVLSGFLSLKSLHPNTRIENFYPAVLGNYSLILDERHIFDKSQFSNVTVEYFTTYRLLVLEEEEQYFSADFKERYMLSSFMRNPSNPRIVVLFSDNIAIDNMYNPSIIPLPIRQRIVRAVRQVHFTDEIEELVNAAVSRLERPILGVTIRSWTAPHEKDEVIGRSYNASAYMHAIRSAIEIYQPRSLLVAFDNPDIAPLYESSLFSTLPITAYSFFSPTVDVHPLTKAAVELLSLAECEYVLGSRESSFLQAVFWFGKLRPIILHPDLF